MAGGTANGGEAQTVTKRTLEDGSDNAPKTKRSRYVTNACNECKRRKVKCNGEDPCQRCINSMIACGYHQPPRNNSMSMQIRAVMERVDSLNERLNAISPASVAETSHPPLYSLVDQPDLCLPTADGRVPASAAARNQSVQPSSPRGTETISPEYHGLTSSEFTFEVANESLNELGVGCSISNPNQPNGSLSFQPIPSAHTADKTMVRRLLTRDPLWSIERVDALRYIDIYLNTLGLMYPVVDAQHFESKALMLFDALDSAKAARCRDRIGRTIELLFSVETNKIKLATAAGLVIDQGAGNDTAVRLVQSVLDSTDDSLMNAEGIGGVQLLVLTALFHYSVDEELKASRYVCLASRRCLEMGLHRREMLLKHFRDEHARKLALRIFWSVFMLDRRSSLGLGVPYVIQDSPVDPSLVAMNVDHLYLRTMIPYTKLSGKAWQMSNEFSTKDVHAARDEIDFLDYQVMQWRKQIPDSLRYSPSTPEHPEQIRNNYSPQQRLYLSVVLFIRCNQLRNVIYRPLLQSSAHIKSNPEHTLTALSIAKESLQTMSDLNSTTNLLQMHAIFFKHFIVSALGNLLLITVHATAEYWTQIRETFHMALGLLRQLSTRCGPVKRVWDRLKGLEDLQAKISSARRREAEGQTVDFLGCEVDIGQSHGEASLNPLSIGPSGGDYMLFDSQIRDEFAGFFDSSFNVGDFLEFPLFDNGERG
ncbi:uncharacterized protein Z518_09721 [Rhinocladiella mackenziei CBS 650.93]|uniref:Zn(2)-C6 fungal-type domain-containing protein n=1 Tax=Rhinocladiella mackenziei CBS 650.93 TaxID=1442369 RepID=A0A0D2IBJ6_9EURO|nr:uncharacterized protein Z518_09721 [Rhinocladiella mackenziei CBS 650.93]KIX00656.1 hypothetical protein Z518_09721 [Rhinocladiella mackenziei CBS 650.93]